MNSNALNSKVQLLLGEVIGTGGFGVVNELIAFTTEPTTIYNSVCKSPSSNRGIHNSSDIGITNIFQHMCTKCNQSIFGSDEAPTEFIPNEIFRKGNPNILTNVGDRRRFGQCPLSTSTSCDMFFHDHFALKTLSKADVLRRPTGLTNLYTELHILVLLRENYESNLTAMSPHGSFICHLHSAFQDNKYVYMVMDLADIGDLRQYLNANAVSSNKNHFTNHCVHGRTGLPEQQIVFIVIQLVLAIGFCHSLGILHRDVKPENILIRCNGYIALTDFGISKQPEPMLDSCKSTSGTHGYMAPEIYAQKHIHGRACDWFALGVTIHELFTNERPYSIQLLRSYKHSSMYAKTGSQLPPLPPLLLLTRQGYFPDSLGTISKQAVELMVELLQATPNERLGYRFVKPLEHSSASENNDYIEILQHGWLRNCDNSTGSINGASKDIRSWEPYTSFKIPSPLLKEGKAILSGVCNRGCLVSDSHRHCLKINAKNFHCNVRCIADCDQYQFSNFKFKDTRNAFLDSLLSSKTIAHECNGSALNTPSNREDVSTTNELVGGLIISKLDTSDTPHNAPKRRYSQLKTLRVLENKGDNEYQPGFLSDGQPALHTKNRCGKLGVSIPPRELLHNKLEQISSPFLRRHFQSSSSL